MKATGKLTIHGVEKERTLDGTITIKGGAIRLGSKFKVHVADHGIKVPTLYVKNIAEDVDVTIDAILEPFKKNWTAQKIDLEKEPRWYLLN